MNLHYASVGYSKDRFYANASNFCMIFLVSFVPSRTYMRSIYTSLICRVDFFFNKLYYDAIYVYETAFIVSQIINRECTYLEVVISNGMMMI